MNIEKAFEIIEKNIGESYISGPIKIDLIKKSETILGVTFPKSYYLFLQRYGELDIFGIEIYGIIKDPIVDAEKIPTMVCLTKEQRKDKNVLLPHELVII